MLDEMIKEIEELKKYKKKYENTQKDKQRMSDIIYYYMMKEYENKSYDERVKEHINKTCISCKYYDKYSNKCYNNIVLKDNVGQPVKSNNGWIPATIGCSEFEWD